MEPQLQNFIYTGERYEQAANTLYNYVQPWYTHDMSLAREIHMRHVRMRICAEINNIFNQQYEVVQCYHAGNEFQNHHKYHPMNNKRLLRASVALMLAVLPFASCRKGEFVLPSTSIEVGGGDSGGDIKVFLLNEGNMGTLNKASLDYYDYETGIYHVNIYAERNPGVVYELGDVGNDIQIYGNKGSMPSSIAATWWR